MFDFLDDRDGEGTPQNMSLLRDEKDPLQYLNPQKKVLPLGQACHGLQPFLLLDE